jgi:hypothetical protein
MRDGQACMPGESGGLSCVPLLSDIEIKQGEIMSRLFFGMMLLVGLMLSAPDAMAQQDKGKGKGAPNAEMRQQKDRAKDAADEAEDRAEQERKRAQNEEGFGGDLDEDQARGAGRGNET